MVEPLSVDVVHREPGVAAATFGLERVVDANDGRMVESPEYVELARESGPVRSALERDVSTEQPVVRPVDGTKATLAERGYEFVATLPWAGERVHESNLSRAANPAI
jgi:hypothetical protein